MAMKTILLLLTCGLVAIQSLCQGGKQRLIAEADYYQLPANQWGMRDSTRFSYSGDRHSRFDYSSYAIFLVD